MAEIKGVRELMRHCCKVNCDYMRLPAGELPNYETLTALYRRMASQSLLCAETWIQARSCADHEPAVDAFWWAVVAWADAFGISAGVDMAEWSREFVSPHWEFADYLRPGEKVETIDPHAGLPAEVIMELDVRWMKMVIKLTARWGLFHHLLDSPALREARYLEAELRKPGSQVRDAYLRSDLKFFQELFKPFPFKKRTRQQLDDWLAMANPDNKEC
jgi:hypothetical protein